MHNPCYDKRTMKNVKISSVCGLCSGCKNAVDTAINLSKTKNVTLFKEIVHNKNVNLMLQNLGISTIETLDDTTPNSHIILRAHGEPPETYTKLQKSGFEFSDCTCKNVTKIHEQVASYSEQGYQIIIIGKYGKLTSKLHPEVLGTIGWCKSEPILIEDDDDLEKITKSKKAKFYLVCQTTFNEEKADKLISKTKDICKRTQTELIINKSICAAQKAINIASVNLAKTVDVMIVVGGKNSSNSLELFNNVKNYTKAIFIEDISSWQDELKAQNIAFDKSTKFGITAGASTLKEELTALKNLIETQKD